jgi:cytoskeletal protein CcmA (bactofilin family)
MFDRAKNKPAATPAKTPDTHQSHPVPNTPATARSVAMIGPSIIIKGEVSGGEDLHIQGRVEGTINLTGNQVSVGESGQVCADIHAKHVKIDGEVTGDVSASENVVISKSGNVRGNIVAPRVTLEDGANFKGSIDMDPSAAASGAAPLSSRQPANSPAPDIKTPALDLKSG